jgi:hypothetical protein
VATPNSTNSHSPRSSSPARPVAGELTVIDDRTKARLLTALRSNQDAGLTPAEQQAETTAPSWPEREELRRRSCSSGKQCFPTEQAARARLAQIYGTSHTGRGYGPINVHGPCRKCGSWHMTAKEMKPWKHGRRQR